ncbi:MAG TPA: DNA methyltransferase [Candidatus Acidoferrum sp.]|nr:DNA methyltransferase [Candidatus Acidoferrum sp.]
MTELIWDGKYDASGKKQGPVRIPLPFQTIETVNESAQDRRRNLELFASGRDTEWRNRLIWGDKKYVLPSLLPEFAGKVNLIYIDPPFDTGANFSFTATIPSQSEDSDNEDTNFTKEPSVLEQKAYRDTWGRGVDSYLHWIFETCVLLRDLLADDGSIYIHVGPNVSHYVKLVLDDIFAEESYRNEVIWQRHGAHNDPQKFGIVHDAIFFYTKGPRVDLQSRLYAVRRRVHRREIQVRRRKNRTEILGKYTHSRRYRTRQKFLQSHIEAPAWPPLGLRSGRH